MHGIVLVLQAPSRVAEWMAMPAHRAVRSRSGVRLQALPCLPRRLMPGFI